MKAFLPLYADYSDCRTTGLHNLNYLKYLRCNIFGGGKSYYPVNRNCLISNIRKIYVGKCSTIARPGCYIQGAGTIRIGNYVQFGPNVGVLSANHDLYDQRKYNTAPIVIGDYSWLGMGSTVLAGVTLGPRTIVAAGAVVTKSFPEGFCVLAGVPAKVVKTLDKERFVPWTFEKEFYGMIPAERFERVRKRYIDV